MHYQILINLGALMKGRSDGGSDAKLADPTAAFLYETRHICWILMYR